MNLRKAFNRVIFFSMLTLCIAGSAVGAEREEIVVSAAMSLKASFEALETLFEEEYPGIDVLMNFNSSGKLSYQIEEGAPVDVFASASMKEMKRLSAKGIVDEGSLRVFAGNAIVAIVPKGSSALLRSFSDLGGDAAKRIVVGNPDTTPVGMYSMEVLKHSWVLPAVKKRLVFAEHVRQILDYVARGEVDAGLLYSTDALVRRDAVTVIMEAPAGSHREIAYPIAIVNGSTKRTAARSFIDAVLSDKGRAVLKRFGFTVPVVLEKR